jgi:hypothetical protein
MLNCGMDLTFYKLRLCDSDIILVDDLAGDGRDRDWEAAARSLLHRRRGAGADRLAVIAKPEADLWLRVFLADGGESPCADAALCAARFLLDSGRSGSEAVPMRISGGELRVDVLDSASLGITLGPPRGIPDGDPISAADAASRATSIEAAGERYQVVPLRAGIPAADAAAVFSDGGAARARARIVASRGYASRKPATRGDAAPHLGAFRRRPRLLRFGGRRPRRLSGRGILGAGGDGTAGLGHPVGGMGRGRIALCRDEARVRVSRRVPPQRLARSLPP